MKLPEHIRVSFTAFAIAIASIAIYFGAYALVGERATIAGDRYNLYGSKFEAVIFWPALKIESLFSGKRILATWTHDKSEPIEPLD